MKKTSYNVLRIGTGITFIWIAYLIWQAPDAWASFIQPWAAAFLPENLAGMMQKNAIFDALLGLWMIVGGRHAWIGYGLGALHVLGVLITTTAGFDNIVVRDIAILAGTLALFFETVPKKWLNLN